MKKMREINYILYVLVTYLLSSLYGIIFRLEVPRILKIENLNNLSILFLVLLITGYLITNFFKSLKEVFKSGVKKLSYVLVIIYGVNINNVALIYAGSICLIVAYAVLFLENRQIKKKEKTCGSENGKEPKLYPSRRNLMEVLNHALEGYSLIALDGTWGSGKTTFMNIFMRDKREKYYYIPINVMLFENRNSLKTEFLNQLKGIFKEEGIFQGSLMDFDYYLDGISNDWVKIAKNIIFSKSKSFKEANEKLKCEIGKIEKKIVVGVDNLERIYGESEPEWKQILGFIHELQELGIKIVVMANLEEMLTTKKETGEKDLSNHEYFDKFYEFKLKLNEVTTGEIIDKVEIKKEELVKKNNIVDREWLKEQIKELTKTLEIGKEVLNDDAEEKKDIKILYNELHERYLKNIVNPRKIGKIIKNIENKKKTIENIYKFINDDEYEKLIFKASIFSSVYFDYMNEIKSEEFNDFIVDKKININNFFGYFFKNIGESHRGMKRLLHHDAEEGLVIKRIENIIKNKGKDEFDLELILKDLEVYSSSLDPKYEQNKSKIIYELIELKIQELEKINIEKAHEIIKENEEFICKMNYLTYPDEVGIYGKVSYKFDITIIMNQYEPSLKKLFIILEYKKDIVEEKGRILTLEKFQEIVGEYLSMDKFWEKQLIPSVLKELKIQIENHHHPKFKLRKKVEDSISKDLISILDILKEEFDKVETLEEESIESKVQDWKKKKVNEKMKLLNDICSSNNIQGRRNFNVGKGKKILNLLNKVLEEENSREMLFFIDEIISGYKNYIFNTEVKEMIDKNTHEKQISKSVTKRIDSTKEELGEIIEFINESRKNDPSLIIFGDNYPDDYKDLDARLTINSLERIGIIRNENGFDLKDN